MLPDPGEDRFFHSVFFVAISYTFIFSFAPTLFINLYLHSLGLWSFRVQVFVVFYPFYSIPFRFLASHTCILTDYVMTLLCLLGCIIPKFSYLYPYLYLLVSFVRRPLVDRTVCILLVSSVNRNAHLILSTLDFAHRLVPTI